MYLPRRITLCFGLLSALLFLWLRFIISGEVGDYQHRFLDEAKI